MLLVGLTLAALAANPPAPKVSRLDLGRGMVVEARHVDPKRFDPADSTEDPPIKVIVKLHGRALKSFEARGRQGWRPWGLARLWRQDLDGNGEGDALLATYSSHGGSGTALYLAAILRAGRDVRVVDLPGTSAENIHSGGYWLARGPRGMHGFVVTAPLMDSPTRAEPTRWQVVLGRIQDGRIVLIRSSRTPDRHSESVPAAALRRRLPPGWKIVGRLY